METRAQTILTELRGLLEACYGERLKRLVLFGSQERGDADPESDMDVLVVLGGPVGSTEENPTHARHALRPDGAHEYILISCTSMDEDRITNYSGPLLRNTWREGVVIL